jgi:hypothetical protein
MNSHKSESRRIFAEIRPRTFSNCLAAIKQQGNRHA